MELDAFLEDEAFINSAWYLYVAGSAHSYNIEETCLDIIILPEFKYSPRRWSPSPVNESLDYLPWR